MKMIFTPFWEYIQESVLVQVNKPNLIPYSSGIWRMEIIII